MEEISNVQPPFLSGFCQGTNFGTLSGTLPFSGKTKEPERLDFKGFQALNEQGMRESNSHQRFWRPLSYHLTNPLYTRKSGHRATASLYVVAWKLHACVINVNLLNQLKPAYRFAGSCCFAARSLRCIACLNSYSSGGHFATALLSVICFANVQSVP